MIHDLVRTACVIVTMTVAASLLVETRFQLAAIDTARRASVQPVQVAASPAPAGEAPGPLARLGRATLGLADAALGVVR